MTEHVYMFAGDSVHVEIHTNRNTISDIMDWFGRDVKIKDVDENTARVEVTVNENAMFF